MPPAEDDTGKEIADQTGAAAVWPSKGPLLSVGAALWSIVVVALKYGTAHATPPVTVCGKVIDPPDIVLHPKAWVVVL
jgi:hypothetical protein